MDDQGTQPRHLRSALRVSGLSIVWTLAAGACAVGFGVASHSVVLVAVGAIGWVDAVGSMALAYHFRHAMTHHLPSQRLEAVALWTVAVGTVLVGVAALVVGGVRLRAGAAPETSLGGLAVATASLLALSLLSARKHWLAPRVRSPALLGDARLSALGALQALVAVLGVGAAAWLHWGSADPAAGTVVGAVAVVVGVATAVRSGRAVDMSVAPRG